MNKKPLVFLAHNSQDKPQVKIIAKQLYQKGIDTWLDEDQIPPGVSFQEYLQKAITDIDYALIFIGKKGIGRWQTWEIRSFFSKLVESQIPVIPVLLPGVQQIPDDLVFLREINYVQFPDDIRDQNTINRIIWGITRKSSYINYDALESSLRSGLWREANAETKRIILQSANREKDGFLSREEMRDFDSGVLLQLDRLWRQYSQNRFGFSIQKKILRDCQQDALRVGVQVNWQQDNSQINEAQANLMFGTQVGWKQSDNWINEAHANYSLSAPLGHLPHGMLQLVDLNNAIVEGIVNAQWAVTKALVTQDWQRQLISDAVGVFEFVLGNKNFNSGEFKKGLDFQLKHDEAWWQGERAELQKIENLSLLLFSCSGLDANITTNVLINGRLVGYLCKLPSGEMSFQYTSEWLWFAAADTQPLSLSLPLTPEVYGGSQVYNFFDNLLPDSQQIRSRIQARFQIPTSHPFDLLQAIGADCVGAIQLSDDQTITNVKKVNAHPLSTAEIAQILRGYQDTPLGMIAEVDDFRISIAGAQEKTALLWYQNQWCRPAGTTPTSHIFKLPISNHSNLDLSESCENEWLCLEIAKTFGLPAANAQIEFFDGVKALVVERFDRCWSSDGKWLMRLPQEDFCQILGVSPNLKYQVDGGPGIEAIMKVLQGAKNADADQELFLRSQVLFWLLGAIDGHAKNFSVYLKPGGSYCLTPLYDILSAYPLISKNSLPAQKIKMAMALKGTSGNHYLWSKIQPRHFLETAKSVNFSTTKAEKILREMLTATEEVANQVARKIPVGFPEHISSAILQGMVMLAKKHQSIDLGSKNEI